MCIYRRITYQGCGHTIRSMQGNPCGRYPSCRSVDMPPATVGGRCPIVQDNQRLIRTRTLVAAAKGQPNRPHEFGGLGMEKETSNNNKLTKAPACVDHGSWRCGFYFVAHYLLVLYLSSQSFVVSVKSSLGRRSWSAIYTCCQSPITVEFVAFSFHSSLF